MQKIFHLKKFTNQPRQHNKLQIHIVRVDFEHTNDRIFAQCSLVPLYNFLY